MYHSTGPVALTAELEDGSTVGAKEIRGDDWKGTLYAVLAPRDQVKRFVLERDGKTGYFQVPDLN